MAKLGNVLVISLAIAANVARLCAGQVKTIILNWLTAIELYNEAAGCAYIARSTSTAM